jgi:tetratricopeptide (TPR) repeat protein
MNRKIRRFNQLMITCWLITASLAMVACSHWQDSERLSHNQYRTRPFTDGDMTHFIGSIRYNRADSGDHYRLGRYFQERGRHMLAVTEFSRSIDLDPLRADAHNAMGVSYDKLLQFDLAEPCYRRALILKPDFAAAYNNLGYSYLMQGRPEEAIAHLKKAVALQGPNIRFHNNLALAYEQTGQVEMASAEFKLSGQDLQKHSNSWQPIEYESQGPDVMITNAQPKPLWAAPQIEISNGNGVYKMARNIGNYFELNGFDVHRLSNADHFGYPQTRIFYSDGQRQVACNLSRMLFGPDIVCDLIYDGQKHGQVKVLVGEDAAGLNDLFSGRLKIQVANGNGVYEIAYRLSSYLREKGFCVVHPTNARNFEYPFTQIVYPTGQLANAQFLARAFPENRSGRLVNDDRNTATIRIVIGKDFVF